MAHTGGTPRVFLARHGETLWSLSGQHTSITDLDLTPDGERRVKITGNALVGSDRLIVPENLACVYVSPRKRAQHTLELLGFRSKIGFPWDKPSTGSKSGQNPIEENNNPHVLTAPVVITEDIREWDYGEYEGLTTKEIREKRKNNGLDQERSWDIWRDGCEGGESPEEVTKRLDDLIADIRSKFHENYMQRVQNKDSEVHKTPCDILILAHGHILRAFTTRWTGRSLLGNPNFIMEAGGVATLSYEHNSVEEPAIILGGAFHVDSEHS